MECTATRPGSSKVHRGPVGYGSHLICCVNLAPDLRNPSRSYSQALGTPQCPSPPNPAISQGNPRIGHGHSVEQPRSLLPTPTYPPHFNLVRSQPRVVACVVSSTCVRCPPPRASPPGLVVGVTHLLEIPPSREGFGAQVRGFPGTSHSERGLHCGGVGFRLYAWAFWPSRSRGREVGIWTQNVLVLVGREFRLFGLQIDVYAGREALNAGPIESCWAGTAASESREVHAVAFGLP